MKLLKSKLKYFTVMMFIVLHSRVAFATGISSFKGITGTTRLLNDLSAALLTIAPILTVVLTVYFSMRKGAAEVQEQQMWEKRKRIAWICCGVAFLGSGIVQLIQAYYG